MTIIEIINHRTTKGNKCLSQLSEIMPEFKDYKFGSKPTYTPMDMKKALQTMVHYLQFSECWKMDFSEENSRYQLDVTPSQARKTTQILEQEN